MFNYILDKMRQFEIFLFILLASHLFSIDWQFPNLGPLRNGGDFVINGEDYHKFEVFVWIFDLLSYFVPNLVELMIDQKLYGFIGRTITVK